MTTQGNVPGTPPDSDTFHYYLSKSQFVSSPPFLVLSPIWQKKTKSTKNNALTNGVTFAGSPFSSALYSLGVLDSILILTRINALDGSEQFSYEIGQAS